MAGIGSADTKLILAPAAGPFLVTSLGAGGSFAGASEQAITWNVAGTNLPPVSTADVRVSLSTDGGLTYPHVLAESTPNDGSEALKLPNVATQHARIKVEAVGNVYFDLSDTDFTIRPAPVVTNDAPAGGATVEYGTGLDPTVTISASDADSAGSSLSAEAVGLPSGISLDDEPVTSEDTTRPGTRAWTLTGDTNAAPGSYPVIVTVTDETGGSNSTSFTIVVTDTTAPVVTVPSAISIEAVAGTGVEVEFTATALDAVDGVLEPTCTPESGSTFPVGDTLVTCSATDAHGNTGQASFHVSVGDSTAPVLLVPAAITVNATVPAGAPVTYSAVATDIVDGPVTPVCTTASGATFPVGTTTVTCTATDAHGNASSASFTVTVRGAAAQLADLIAASRGVGHGKDLVAHAQKALKELEGKHPDKACKPLEQYLKELGKHKGKKVSPALAAILTADATRIASVLGCSS